MRPTYDLIAHPWIPCLLPDGKSVEYGLFEVLLRSPEIRQVFHAFPPVTAALHRLLLAILHRNFGPTTQKTWIDLWKQGRWDENTLTRYFDRWNSRFDLFHLEYPFYQVSTLKPKSKTEEGYEPSPVGKMALASSVGNNPTLFDHSLDGEPVPFSPAEAARLVVAYQGFNQGGLVSRIKGEPPSCLAAPLAKGAVILYEGNNLFETLMSNMLPYDTTVGQPFTSQSESDSPTWEQEPEFYRTERRPRGYLDYLTWQSMRIRLFPEIWNGQVVVRQAILAAGAQMKRDLLLEPQFAYKKNTKPKLGPADEPWLPVRFRTERSLWRDSTALLTAGTEQETPPAACKWLASLAARGIINRSRRYRLGIYGICSDRAKVDFWRQEYIPVPAHFFGDPTRVDILRDCLQVSENVGRALKFALQPLATEPKNGKEALPQSVLSTATRQYWSGLESPFTVLLANIPPSGDEARWVWVEAVRGSARQAFEYSVQSLEHSGRFLKDVVKARRRLEWQMARTVRKYKEGEYGQE